MPLLSRRRAVVACLVLAPALPFVLAGCGRKEQGKYVVGFSQMESDNPWRLAETKSLRDEAAKRGYELVVTDAQGQTAKQVSNVEDLIARRVNLILLAPREYEGLAPALQAAKEAKIPVILVDRAAAGTPGEDYVTLLASNFVEQGKRAAEWLAKKTNGQAKIVELSGTAGASVAKDRGDGFREGIKAYPGMQIVASQTGDFSRASAQRVMQNVAQSLGKQITAVYAHNDEMALGAIEALKAVNKLDKVLVGGVDATGDALAAMKAGDLKITVFQDAKGQGAGGVDAAVKLYNGDTVPGYVDVPYQLVTPDNLADFEGK